MTPTHRATHYRRLLIMIVISFIVMHLLMYAMVDNFANVIPNLNQLYMAGLMTAAMVIIELAIMGFMYTHKRWNWAILGVSSLLLLGCWFGIRQQFAIGDTELLRSMVPHHAGAVLMCKQANLEDAEVKELCERIISSQQEEINWMKMKAEELQ